MGMESKKSAVRQSYTYGTGRQYGRKDDNILDYNRSGLHVYIINDSDVIVGIRYPHVLYFDGVLSVRCIIGTVEILGWRLDAHSPKVIVSSVMQEHVYGIRTCDGGSSTVGGTSILVGYGIGLIQATHLMNDIGPKGAVILLDYSESYINEHLKRALNLNGFNEAFRSITVDGPFVDYSEAELVLNTTLDSDKGYRLEKCEIKSEWSTLFDNIMSSRPSAEERENREFKVVICGGKRVGKSSLMRYLINKTLAQFNKVLVIDFDIGQPEFTMPGCISAVIVKKPILSPNFCNFTTPLRCLYVGNVDVSNCFSLYLKSLLDIAEFCRNNEEVRSIPWFVNTMGFVKSLGLKIINQIIHHIRPDNLVQFESANKGNNFPYILNSTNMGVDSQFSHKTHGLKSVTDKEGGLQRYQSYSPSDRRKIITIAYLYGNFFPKTDFLVSPDQVYIKRISSPYCKECKELIQGNLLAFTNSEINGDTISCLGFGMVNSEKTSHHCLDVSAIMNASIADVKGVVIGCLKLPDSILKHNCDLKGDITHYLLSTVKKECKTQQLFFNYV